MLITQPDAFSGSASREFLGKENRRAKIDVELGLPARPVERIDRIPFEPCGVVDEAGGWPKLLGARPHKAAQLILAGEIGLKGNGLRSKLLDLHHKGVGFGGGGAVMDPDSPAALGEIERDGPAEAKSRAGDKRDRGA